jgi:hypothetical protein
MVLNVMVHRRHQTAKDVQAALTEFGCSIKTRLGLHTASATECSPNGLILLEMTGSEAEAVGLEHRLSKIPGVFVSKVEFEI